MNLFGDEIPEVFRHSSKCLYHYTRLETAVERILPSETLLMNPFANMRDPRESRLLEIEGVSGFADQDSDLDEDWDLGKEIRRFAELDAAAKDLKNRAKVLCLTRDDGLKRDEESTIYGLGFAHPRLWEHYANGHRGVCLCLDGEVLVQQARHAIHALGGLQHKAVAYVDSALARQAREVIMSAAQHQSGRDTLTAHLAQHADEIFFTKLKDWETEREYRLVVVTDDERPVRVPIRPALEAIIVGASVNHAYLASIREAWVQNDIPIYRITWPYGYPRLALTRD